MSGPSSSRFSAPLVLRDRSPQERYLMSQGDALKLQGGAATNTEGEQRNEGGKNRDHTHDGMSATQRSLGSLCVSEF